MNRPDATFRHIPVMFVRELGLRFHKDQVVVLAFDSSCGVLSTATWGRTAEDKIVAARAGDQLSAAAGADMAAKIPNEDFRTVDAGQRAAENEQLRSRCTQLTGRLKEAIELVRGYAGLEGKAWANDVVSSGLMTTEGDAQ